MSAPTWTNPNSAYQLRTRGIAPNWYKADTSNAPFSPSDVAGLIIWLIGDDLTGADGAAIATWTDASGEGNDATQGTADNRPVKKTNILNGHAVARFDGTNDSLSLVDLSAMTAGTVFIVTKNSGGTTGMWSLSNAGGQAFYPFGGQIYETFGSTVRRDALTAVVAFTDFHTYTVRADSSTWQAWQNGTSVFSTGTNTFVNRAAPTLGTNGISLLTGDIAEFVLYDAAITTEERESVEAYLAEKYAL